MKAVDIKTELWKRIITDLLQEGWGMASEYQGFDKGIDYNAYCLEQNNVQIEFEWDNWSEGEIKCTPEISEILKNKYSLVFTDEHPSKP